MCSPYRGISFGCYGNYGNVGNYGNPGNHGSIGTIAGYKYIELWRVWCIMATDESRSLLLLAVGYVDRFFLWSKAEGKLLFKLKLEDKIMRSGINEWVNIINKKSNSKSRVTKNSSYSNFNKLKSNNFYVVLDKIIP